VQPVVRQKLAHLGDRGEQWLAELPDRIGELERRWSITVDEPVAGGTAAFVARAHSADGRAAVLKLALPDSGFASQVRTLQLAQGHGYVRLLASDLEGAAALLEALGPSLDRLGLLPEQQIAVLCATLRRAWQVARPAGLTVEPAQEKARALGELVGRLWERLGRPCSERVVDGALACARRRAAAFDLDRCVVVHGDPHPGNALRVLSPRAGGESGFVFVDPDGFLADPAYDLGVVLRDWCGALLTGDAPALARRYCALLAARTGVDETAIWEWGFLERVSTGLYALEYGAEDLSRPFLATAELLAPALTARRDSFLRTALDQLDRE
jgi:streptomycin 6-kinase